MLQRTIKKTVKLAQAMLPSLAEVLSRQRGKYYGFGAERPEYPVFEQAENVDLAPVNNLQQERQCGDIDHRLKKKQNLDTASRGVVLKGTSKLRKEVEFDFHKMGEAVKLIKET